VRNQDDLLKERAVEFMDRLRSNLAVLHLNAHLRSRPIRHEWLDSKNLIIHLHDVEAINEIDIHLLQKALEVQSHWTITPLHPNRMQVTFQCHLNPMFV
jgi:hypothetical protein